MTMLGFRVRPARADELGAVRTIETAAAARFRTSAHPHAADMPSLGEADLARMRADDNLWVLEVESGELVAFIALEPLGADLYVVELDVLPSHAGARLGATLLDHAAVIARHRGYARLVLRTFVDVPWNAPYYRTLGFVDVDDAPVESLVEHEAAAGLDVTRRVTLARGVQR